MANVFGLSSHVKEEDDLWPEYDYKPLSNNVKKEDDKDGIKEDGEDYLYSSSKGRWLVGKTPTSPEFEPVVKQEGLQVHEILPKEHEEVNANCGISAPELIIKGCSVVLKRMSISTITSYLINKHEKDDDYIPVKKTNLLSRKRTRKGDSTVAAAVIIDDDDDYIPVMDDSDDDYMPVKKKKKKDSGSPKKQKKDEGKIASTVSHVSDNIEPKTRFFREIANKVSGKAAAKYVKLYQESRTSDVVHPSYLIPKETLFVYDIPQPTYCGATFKGFALTVVNTGLESGVSFTFEEHSGTQVAVVTKDPNVEITNLENGSAGGYEDKQNEEVGQFFNSVIEEVHNGLEKMYSCTRCGFSQKKKKALELHFKSTHVKCYRCTACPAVFEAWHHIYCHVRNHKEAQMCGICGNLKLDRKSMIKHMKLRKCSDLGKIDKRKCSDLGKKDNKMVKNIALKDVVTQASEETTEKYIKIFQETCFSNPDMPNLLIPKETIFVYGIADPTCNAKTFHGCLVTEVTTGVKSDVGFTFEEHPGSGAHGAGDKEEPSVAMQRLEKLGSEEGSVDSEHKTEGKELETDQALSSFIKVLFEGKKKLYTCVRCNFANRKRDSVEAHFRNIHVKHLTCTSCQEVFTRWSSMAYHLKSHREVHMCSLCRHVDFYTQCMRRHMMSHEEYKKVAPEIEKVPATRKIADNNIQDSRPRFPCGECSKVFRNKECLDEHIDNIHTKTSVMCNVCGRILANKMALTKHAQCHMSTFPCSICSDVLPTRRALLKHVHKKHRGRPPKKLKPRLDGDYSVWNGSIEASKEEVEKYLGMLQEYCRSKPTSKWHQNIAALGRDEQVKDSGSTPETVFVFLPGDSTNIRPTYRGYTVKRFSTGITSTANYIVRDWKGNAEGRCQSDTMATAGSKDSVSMESNDDNGDEVGGDNGTELYRDPWQLELERLISAVKEVEVNSNKYYVCPKCYYQGDRDSVVAHLKQKHSTRKFVCTVCSASFDSLLVVRTHLRYHKVVHMCGVCGKAHNNTCSLKNHMQSHQGNVNKTKEVRKRKRVFFCPHCGKKFSSHKTNLKLHIADHSCTECGETFDTIPQVENHLWKVHAVQFVSHQRKVRQPTVRCDMSCPVCSRICPSKPALKSHMLTHDAIGKYLCDVCGKCFRQPRTLVTHKMTVHEGKSLAKPWQCDKCGKCLMYASTRKTHVCFSRRGRRAKKVPKTAENCEEEQI